MVLILLGVGLTSLVMTFVSEPAGELSTYRAVLAQAIETAAVPDEILLSGVGVEDVIIEGGPWRGEGLGDALKSVPFLLIPRDDDVKTLKRHYWILGRDGQLPEVPEGYEQERISETEGLVVESWKSTGPLGYRLLDHLDEAEARFVPESEGEPRPCTLSRFGARGRKHCGPNSWNWVGASEVTISGKPIWCIWAHPLAQHELRITFPEVPLDRPLSGRYGLTDDAASTQRGSPVTFKILVDGEEVINRLAPNRRGLHQYRVPERTEGVELTFVVTAPKDGRRHFCFDGEIK